ncbi:MAG: protein translocase SEC61 complex subunit gamma [Candidatus Pacearchaeota archaeon]|nr:protein translocase SEC61 complex subunit gamma [Candidatus Pacearchaeota archaeon]
MGKLKSFIAQSVRVWRILKKPTKQEFSLISKVSAIGILVLGIIGFLISLVVKAFN